MSVREMIITRQEASKMLDMNKINRRLDERRAHKLARAMERGEWQFNGDTIRIGKSGVLLDGQHRLKAIEISNIPQRYIVVDDIDDEAFTTIDIGTTRTASQMLEMTGEKFVTALAAAARLHILYASTGHPLHGNHDHQPTHTQIVDFAENSEAMKASSAFSVNSKWLKKYITPSISAFCHYEFGRVDPEARDGFFSEMVSGDFSYRNSPIRYVRDLLIEEAGRPGSPNRPRRIALIFRAFNLYRQGREAKIVRLLKDQAEWYLL